MKPDFSRRNDLEELMDDPEVGFEEMAKTLEGLDRVNRFLGGYAPSIDGIARLAKSSREISILDVGTGGGDTPRRIARWARRRDLKVKITGIDLSDAIVGYARQKSRCFENIEIRRSNLFDMEGDRSFDVVHAALMLHHLSDQEVRKALRKMYALSCFGVVVNDLHRHRFGYLASRVVLPAISDNHLVRHDGPVSVLRSFSKEELLGFAREAGLPEPQLRWWPFFRWQMILRRSGV